MQIAGEGLLAGAMLSFNRRDLQMRRNHLGLEKKLAPGVHSSLRPVTRATTLVPEPET